jgi:hypothetical protein
VSKKSQTHLDLPQAETIAHEKDDTFSGLARSVECYDNQGFRNFRIVTLHIKCGSVVRVEKSDAYASFEAIARMELANEKGIWNLSNRWKDRDTMSK